MSKSGNASKGSRKRKSAKAARRRRNRIILFIAEFFVLAILGIILWIVYKAPEKINLSEDKGINDEKKDYFDLISGSNEKLADGEVQKNGYMQVALFGVDSREGELNQKTRTDTIIIASINLDTKDVKLCSVFRDTYLNLSNDSYNKCNSAYAKGGPAQAIQMLNMNLDLNIQDYITVGFKGVVDTVDALGGVEIDLTNAEIGYLNDYQYCICEDLNRMDQFKKVTSEGLQNLTGLQACGYCRIRYTAGDDFKRTERQRTVLTKMTDKAKKMNPTQISGVVTGAFENVSTSFDLNEILAYAGDVPTFNIVGSEGFPFSDYRAVGTIGSKGSCVIPTDLTTNVSMLHQFLFGVENYDPSSVVKECSEKIKSDTTPYL